MSTGTLVSTVAGGRSDDCGLRFNEIELTLGLPGDPRERKSETKRKFLDVADLKLSAISSNNRDGRVIGWPPLRKNKTNNIKCNKYVKVVIDGAPYMRKVDLKSYTCYRQLLSVLKNMVSCFKSEKVLIQKKLMDGACGLEHVLTYEDKDGDWMLVGDVPWKMFVKTCKRIRVTRSSEAIKY